MCFNPRTDVFVTIIGMSKPKKSKRFTYNLEAVLRVKMIRERQEKDKFHDAEKRVLEEQAKLEDLKVQQKHQYTTLLEMMSGQVANLDKITLRKYHLEAMKEKIADQETVCTQAEEKKESQRQELLRAVKEKKIMDKDKEKKKHAWKRLMDKEDGKFLDDISTIGYELRRRQDNG